jgi:hypothetical protein
MSCVQVLHSSFTAELCSAESMPPARNPIVTGDFPEISKKEKKRIAACAARHSSKLRKSEQRALCFLRLMISASPMQIHLLSPQHLNRKAAAFAAACTNIRICRPLRKAA